MHGEKLQILKQRQLLRPLNNLEMSVYPRHVPKMVCSCDFRMCTETEAIRVTVIYKRIYLAGHDSTSKFIQVGIKVPLAFNRRLLSSADNVCKQLKPRSGPNMPKNTIPMTASVQQMSQHVGFFFYLSSAIC